MDQAEEVTLFPVEPYVTGDVRPPREPKEQGEVVPRQPGWTLLADRHGPLGYHLIKAQGMHGLMYAMCGRFGRYVPDHERGIIMCPECVTAQG